MNEAFVLCRSDRGDGGWSLHRPGATDEEIREGDAPPILSGPAAWVEDNWDRPNAADYAEARRRLDWRPTHRLHRNLEIIEVMLVIEAGKAGPAYTKEEWDSTIQADYERDEEGRWLFQGRPFGSPVQRIEEEGA